MDVFRFSTGNYETQLKLVRNLCHEPEFLSSAFLFHAWNSINSEQKEKLKEFLPKVTENNEQFQEETLHRLFNGKHFKFGNPVFQFKMKLANGVYTDSGQLKKDIIKRHRRRKEKLTLVTEHFANLSDLRLQAPPSLSHDVKRLSRHAAKKLKSMNLDERVGKRHITELRRIRLEVQEKGDSSDDESFIHELMTERDRKMKKLKCLQDWQQTKKVQAKQEENDLPDLPALEEISKSVTLEERPPNTELEPENNFFSLLKYFFCQVENQALTIPDLTEAVQQWESGANHQLVTWIGNSASWVQEIPSAVAFLSGAFPQAQPPGFVPIIQCDPASGLYQWKTEQEVNLAQLASWWLERRSLCQAVTSENQELKEFHAQELVRMLEQPQQPFIYKKGEQKIQVGPIQNPPDTYFNDQVMQTLVNHPGVTFYALVQDALFRLQDGQGSLEDISNLVKQSQFLQSNCEPTTLLKKIALALTNFQRGQILPFVAFNPNTRQYVIQKAAPMQPQAPPPAVVASSPQQPPPTPNNPTTPSGVMLQQRGNVGHLVQVRTPQGLKLYRLASPSTTPTAVTSGVSHGSVMTPTTPYKEVSNVAQQQLPEDTVIVRNSDGRYVQMPRSILKKLINSGQLKQTNNASNNVPKAQTIDASPPLAPRISSNDVLNLLPTVPVRQEHLPHE